MTNKEELIRFSILGTVVAFIFILFFHQLTILQIAEGETYKKQATEGSVTKRYIPAVRGEIVDRYGRPFTSNRVGYDIVLDRTYLPSGKENQILVSLITIMEELGQEWNDNLPITMTQPFAFDGTPQEIAQLKGALNVGEFATAEECLLWLADEKFYNIAIYDPITKEKIQDYDLLTTRKLAGIRYEMIQNAFSHQNVYVFAQDVGEMARDTIMEYSYQLPGVDIMEAPVREYVDGTIAPHVLGITGPLYKEDIDNLEEKGKLWSPTNTDGYKNNEYIGKSGIEYAFEDSLRGTSGERLITFDIDGNVINVEDTVPPTPGNTVVLTLDKDLQVVAQNALADTIKSYNENETLTHSNGKDANAGVAIVQHVDTGEILAMANYPSYDISTYLEDFDTLSKQKPEPLLNRATRGTYRPGSIFKPVVAVAGLSEQLITPTELINCTRVYSRFTDRDFTCMSHHGNINVNTALQRSCNIYFYETGWRLGIATMNDYTQQLGLGVKTNIEIPESIGTLSSPAFTESLGGTWNPGDVIQAAIGQLDHSFTPIQLSSYTSTLANMGTRMQTHLVKATKSYDFKENITETPVTVVEQIDTPPDVFETVRGGMVAATALGGTSYNAWIDFPYTVASKTGTPEGTTTLTSTYICYIPAEDPEIAITIVLEKGGQGYTGAPVARLIAESYFFNDKDQEMLRPQLTLLP